MWGNKGSLWDTPRLKSLQAWVKLVMRVGSLGKRSEWNLTSSNSPSCTPHIGILAIQPPDWWLPPVLCGRCFYSRHRLACPEHLWNLSLSDSPFKTKHHVLASKELSGTPGGDGSPSPGPVELTRSEASCPPGSPHPRPQA